MSITLRVIYYKEKPPLAPNAISLDTVGGTVGRSEDATWSLHDPENFLSGIHARIDFRDGGYVLTDSSTNGVFVNGSRERIPKGGTLQLKGGEVLAMGNYQIAVEIVAERSMAARLGEYLPESEGLAGGVELSSEPPIPGTDGIAEAACRSVPEPRYLPAHNENSQLGGGYMDLPRPLPPADAEKASEFPVEKSAGARPVIPADWNQLRRDLGQPSRRELPSAPAAADERASPVPAATRVPAPGGGKAVFVKAVDGPSPGLVPPISPAAPTAPEQPETGGADLHAALLKGLGLASDRVARQPLPHLLERFGRMFRTALSGALDIIGSRRDFKGEFHLSQTYIQRRENNPLKFVTDVDSALVKLLQPSPDSGFLDADRAVREACDDIRAHQLAVLAGMQAGLREVLSKLDPASLRPRADGAKVIRYRMSKSVAWDRYVARFEQIRGDADEDIKLIFGDAFAKAYKEQIERFEQASDEANDAS